MISCIGRGEATSKLGWLLLLRHDLILDLVVGCLRDDLLLN
jgi:hypothetical protein